MEVGGWQLLVTLNGSAVSESSCFGGGGGDQGERERKGASAHGKNVRAPCVMPPDPLPESTGFLLRSDASSMRECSEEKEYVFAVLGLGLTAAHTIASTALLSLTPSCLYSETSCLGWP